MYYSTNFNEIHNLYEMIIPMTETDIEKIKQLARQPNTVEEVRDFAKNILKSENIDNATNVKFLVPLSGNDFKIYFVPVKYSYPLSEPVNKNYKTTPIS